MSRVVHRTTYPNGEIYVGMDATNSIDYFGSADDRLVKTDVMFDERQSFTITRDILWSSREATDAGVGRVGRSFILTPDANDPAIGYNRRPRWRPDRVET